MTIISIVAWWLKAWIGGSANVNYHGYLQSRAWDWRRKTVRKRAGGKCQIGAYHKGQLHVHHNNYLNLGREKWSDLICVCSHCHRVIHKELFK